MDFSLTTEQQEIARLASTIFASTLDGDRWSALASAGTDFDAELWSRLGQSGLLSLTIPDRMGGAGLGVVDACQVFMEAGRHVAPVPVGPHVAAATVLARHASAELCTHWLPAVGSGEVVITAALTESGGTIPDAPDTRADPESGGYRVEGRKTLVAAGTAATLFLVPVRIGDSTALLLIERGDDGVTLVEQELSGGYRVAELLLAGVRVPAERLVGDMSGRAAHHLAQLVLLADCAQQFGVTQELVRMTAEYASRREQFSRPIGSFQAVGHRLADGYIDTLGQELTLWKAAYLIDSGSPADASLAAAKFWAAEAGHRVCHSAIHIHGGVGVDLLGEVHRYYSMAKHLEFRHGGAHHHAERLGALMADPERIAAETL